MNYKKIISIVTGLSILAASLMSNQVGALGAASMTLSGTSNASGNFSVSVYEDTGGETVTGANVELSFSQAVSGVNYDYSVGSFPAVTPSGAHNAYGAVTGSKLVAVVSFTVANPGTVVATVNSNSYLKHVEGTTIEYFAINRGSAAFTYSAPAPSNPTTGSGSTGSNSTQSSSSTNKTVANSKTSPTNGTNTTITSNDQKVATTNKGSEKTTPTSKNSSKETDNNQKVASYNPTLAIVLALLVVLAGAATIYAKRNPKKIAAIASAAWLLIAPKKKAAATPAKKMPAKKTKSSSKTTKATKSKKTSTKKPAKKS